jgi:hypothetical protein
VEIVVLPDLGDRVRGGLIGSVLLRLGSNDVMSSPDADIRGCSLFSASQLQWMIPQGFRRKGQHPGHYQAEEAINASKTGQLGILPLLHIW